MIRGITTEVLFDITQAGEITYSLTPPGQSLSTQIAMIDSEQQIITQSIIDAIKRHLTPSTTINPVN
jgi:hypothetical protein